MKELEDKRYYSIMLNVWFAIYLILLALEHSILATLGGFVLGYYIFKFLISSKKR